MNYWKTKQNKELFLAHCILHLYRLEHIISVLRGVMNYWKTKQNKELFLAHCIHHLYLYIFRAHYFQFIWEGLWITEKNKKIFKPTADLIQEIKPIIEHTIFSYLRGVMNYWRQNKTETRPFSPLHTYFSRLNLQSTLFSVRVRRVMNY